MLARVDLPDGRRFRLALEADGTWRLQFFTRTTDDRWTLDRTPGLAFDAVDFLGFRDFLVRTLRNHHFGVPGLEMADLAARFAEAVDGGTTRDFLLTKIFRALDLALKDDDDGALAEVARWAHAYTLRRRPDTAYGAGSAVLRGKNRSPVARQYLLAAAERLCRADHAWLRAHAKAQQRDDEYEVLAERLGDAVRYLFPEQFPTGGSAAEVQGHQRLARKLRGMKTLQPEAVARAALRAFAVLSARAIDNFFPHHTSGA